MVTKLSSRGERVLHEVQAPYLIGEERKLLARFVARLEDEFGDSIRRVILFGSKARGDADAESDTDVWIVTADEETVPRVRQTADAIRSEALDAEPPVVLYTLVMSEDAYRVYQFRKLPLYVNARRDGIELWNEQAWAAEQIDIPLDFDEGEFRTMNKGTLEMIRQYVDTSHDFWRMAMHDKEGGFLKGAVSRAYYAMFHSVTAALFAVNVVRGKHSGVASAISYFLVKPGYVEQEYKDIYDRLMKARLDVDYGGERDKETGFAAFPQLPDAEMERMLVDAERFVARMEQFLRERGAIE